MLIREPLKKVPRGWRRLAPGLYVDDNDEGHLVIPELLIANRCEVNEGNERLVIKAAVKAFARQGIEIAVGDPT